MYVARMDPETHARKYPHLVDDTIPPRLLASWMGRLPATCLDVGCGDGRLLHALERHGYLRDVEVYAIDASPLRISRLRSLHPDFDCHVGDACDLTPIADASIDFAISTMVIEHVDDPARMLNELSRVLSENGLLYLTTVFKTPGAWYFRKRGEESVLDPTHVREYTAEEQLTGLTTDAGLALLGSVKTRLIFPLVDPLLRLANPRGAVLDGPFWRVVRRLVVRVPGYWTWELLVARR
jgi:SAM-dependent methyltransferase